MKKAVFLLCIMFFTLPLSKISAIGEGHTYEFDDFNIIVEYFKLDGQKGITVEKTGTDPFFTTIYDESENYIINGVTKTKDFFILYGSNHVNGNDTYYDAIFMIIDYEGNLVKKETTDFGDLEETVGAYVIDDTLIMHVTKTTDDGRELIFINNFFSSYNMSFELLDTIDMETEIYKITQNEKYILFNFEYDYQYDGGIREDLSILLPSDQIDIANQQVFYNEINIEFLNKALLNDEVIENGVYIDYPGNYKLTYKNAEYNFIVKSVVSGFEDDKSYTTPVTPLVSSGNSFLNNDLFISGTEITEPGNYELTVTGSNEYVETYNFTITSNLEGIINNHTYLNGAELSFNGEGYLNNQLVTSPLEVYETGEYVLKIKGENNYLETYYFVIEDNIEKASLIDFVQKFDIFALVVVLITGGIILKKK